MRATIPAEVCGWEADIYIDAVQWGRRDEGSMTFKIETAGCSSRFLSGAVTVAAVAGSTLLLKQATSHPILPGAHQSVPVLNSKALEKIKDILICF